MKRAEVNESGSGSGASNNSAARSAQAKALLYGALNIISASGIVFANKVVFANFQFKYTFALTWIHTAFTLVGMRVMAASGMFDTKVLSQVQLFPLAAAYVAYIVLCNLSLKVNTVGFYQVMKIAVAPTVLVLDLILFRKIPPPKVVASVAVVCLGIGLATVNDTQMVTNVYGIIVGVGATIMTALYQIWAGSKQKDLKASSMQLLHAYTPQSAVLLGILVPLCEPLGWKTHAPDTLLGYKYSTGAVVAIIISAVLGLLVSLSTFLVIGATSSLTYNVVGHLKTVIILSGGCLLFGDAMPLKKFLGVCTAMVGIIWYTQLKLVTAPRERPTTSRSSAKQPAGNGFLPGLTAKSVFTSGMASRRRI